MNIPRPIQAIAVVAICSTIGIATGCQSTKTKLAEANPLKSLNEQEVPLGVPDRVVGTWTEAVLHKSGTGTRGFGGRLYFYERGSAKPIRVEGQLVVYAFAEDGRTAANNKPTKRYVFPAHQFARHESESEVGVSYSVWLPWDAAGGEQVDVSLIARFEPSQGGGLVVSDQTNHRLPGTPRSQTLLADEVQPKPIRQTAAIAGNSMQAQQAVFEAETKSGAEARQANEKMKTTTISLPRSFQNAHATTNPRPKPAVQQRPAQVTRQQPTLGTAAPPTPATEAQPEPVTTTPAMPATAPIAPAGAATMDNPQPTPFGTTVEYLTPGESIRRSLAPRSFDSIR